MSEDVYRVSCQNIKDLRKHRNRLNSLFNRAIREKNDADMQTFTKLYALLYSAYAEVSLVKLINTPNAFSDAEIDQILKARNLEEKWVKCSELAFQRINTNANLGEIAYKKLTLERICKQYIIDPSQIRNKVAHGQWSLCLNNDCTSINNDTTTRMQQIDFVKIDRLFSIYEKYHQCLLDLMISPRTHYRDYYQIITDLEVFVEETSNWSLETKKKINLKLRKISKIFTESK